MKRKIGKVTALALAAMMVLSACSSGQETADATIADGTTAAAAPRVAEEAAKADTQEAAEGTDSKEKVLKIGTYMPVTTLVPWKTTSDGDGYIIRQIYHTLLEMNKQSEFTPSLAASWECSEDGKVWTLHLRDDVYWQT